MDFWTLAASLEPTEREKRDKRGRHEPLNMAFAFKRSQTGRGFPLWSLDELKAFDAYVRSRGAVICNVETFEVRGEWESPRIDLGMYEGDPDFWTMPRNERIARSLDTLSYIVRMINLEGIACVFQVWADDLEPPGEG